MSKAFDAVESGVVTAAQWNAAGIEAGGTDRGLRVAEGADDRDDDGIIVSIANLPGIRRTRTA